MKKKEGILIAGVLIIALLCAGAVKLLHTSGTVLRISVAGETYGEYSLKKDQEISIMDRNRCKIEAGRVTMIEASCPDHLCMKQKSIDTSGGTIVCLPNQVILEIIEE